MLRWAKRAYLPALKWALERRRLVLEGDDDGETVTLFITVLWQTRSIRLDIALSTRTRNITGPICWGSVIGAWQAKFRQTYRAACPPTSPFPASNG